MIIMKIGEALKEIRLNLGLSQAKMCEGIIQRPFYTLVENGKSGIGAESLILILIKHEVDVDYFYNLVKDSYTTPELLMDRLLQSKMDEAVNVKDIKTINLYKNKIIKFSTNEILKLRSQVIAAYFSNQLDEINNETKEKIYKEFDKEEWTKNPEILRLLANTMPLWEQDALFNLMSHLLRSIRKKVGQSELMIERYIRILENFLVTCYEKDLYKKKEYTILIGGILNYIIENTSLFHFMIYRMHAYYMKALYKEDKVEAINICNLMKKYGYGDLIASWPKIKM